MAMRGDFEVARAYLEKDGALLTELGLVPAAAAMRTFNAIVELLAGDPASAESILRDALNVLQRLSERWYLADVIAVLAEAVYEQGREQEAWDLTQACQKMKSQDISATMRNLGVQAKIQAVRTEPGAVRLAQSVVRLADATDHLDERGNAYMALADVLTNLDRRRQAVEAARQASLLYKQKGNIVALGRARDLLAELTSN